MTTKEQTIPKGYKHTEVGVIPSDWESKRIGDIFRVTRGQVLSMRKVSPIRLGDYQYPVYSSQTEANGLAGYYTKFLFDSCITWTTDGANAGDVKYRPGKFYCTNVCGVLENKHGYANLCIAAIFNSVSRKYVSYVGNPKLMNNVVADIVIGIPPTIQEQTAIATALSDTDALIEKLTRLIEKKKSIKQGAMQELLTGKRRLPGFSGKWETKKLGDVAEMNSGGTPTTSVKEYYGGTIPWVSITDMTSVGKYLNDTDRKLTEAGFQNSVVKMFPPGTILYAMYASIGECCISTIPVCTSQAILGIRMKESLDNVFVYYYLVSQKAKMLNTGQQGTQSNLNAGIVKSIEISLPKKEEQTAIATVLSDMDIEIERLELQLSKYQNLKQGMMQTLLTGKIRLI